jgi:hypothetical protein
VHKDEYPPKVGYPFRKKAATLKTMEARLVLFDGSATWEELAATGGGNGEEGEDYGAAMAAIADEDDEDDWESDLDDD